MLETKTKQNKWMRKSWEWEWEWEWKRKEEKEKVLLILRDDDDNMNKSTQRWVNHFRECESDRNGRKSTDDQWARRIE